MEGGAQVAPSSSGEAMMGPGPSAAPPQLQAPSPEPRVEQRAEAVTWSCAHVISSHSRAVSSLEYSAEGLLASASGDCTVKIWNGTSGAHKATLAGHDQGISDVAWSSDSRFLASASDDKTINLWDATKGVQVLGLKGHTSYVFCVNFNRQSNLLVSGSFDENVKIWDIRTGACLRTLPAHSDPVTAASFNKDGSCIVSGSHDGLIRLWDTASGQCMKTLFAEGSPPVSHVTYAPNGKYLLASTLDDTIRLWDISDSTKCIKAFRGHDNKKYSMHCHFGARKQSPFIVSGSESNEVFIWDLNSRKVLHRLQGHNDAVLAVAPDPTGTIIASGGSTADATIRLWWQESDGHVEVAEEQHQHREPSAETCLSASALCVASVERRFSAEWGALK
mmetsp:Transcript_2815/g.8062  ORF Transcript_2815/g.8062 Transcript_2815/m.8062 type:complete len:391 (-) Transcript_2815:118-1290(-)